MNNATSQEQVSDMFNAISARYDRTNRLLSFGIDRRWRKAVVPHLPKGDRLHLLDCATGTCDQLLSLMESGKIDRAVGIDLAEEMLQLGQKKVGDSPYVGQIELKTADALKLPFDSDHFDCVTMAFGIRNVQGNCLPELLRVLKPGGKLLILEFSLPSNRLVRACHLLYLRHLLPLLGGLIAKNRAAYRYLNGTIETFPYGEAFLKKLDATGFAETKVIPLNLGIASLYTGIKP